MPMHLLLAIVAAATLLLITLYTQRHRLVADRRERSQLARIAELASREKPEPY
jgi:hypothetical protein